MALDTDRCRAARKAFGNEHRERGRGGTDNARGDIADSDFWKADFVDWKVGTVDGDAPTGHGAQGLNRRQAFTCGRGRHKLVYTSVDGRHSTVVSVLSRQSTVGLVLPTRLLSLEN
jgi:hypothetical protein